MPGRGSAAGTTREGGLLGTIKKLVSTLVAVIQTRLELLKNEVKEEGLRLTRLALVAALAVFFFVLGIIFLTLLVIVFFWDSHRILVVGGFAALYLSLAAAFGWMVNERARERSRLFEASLRELAKDRERLSL
jgi:uncharacterized membrane protein YqjE